MAIAHDVVEQAGALPLAASRTVGLEADGRPVHVNGDPRRLHQVLLNIATNPLQHTPEGGCATVAVYPLAGQACADVRDTGTGVPGEYLEHIFDRFYRIDSARNSGTGDAGLGLAIARAIVEAHGGTIAASNATNPASSSASTCRSSEREPVPRAICGSASAP